MEKKWFFIKDLKNSTPNSNLSVDNPGYVTYGTEDDIQSMAKLAKEVPRFGPVKFYELTSDGEMKHREDLL